MSDEREQRVESGEAKVSVQSRASVLRRAVAVGGALSAGGLVVAAAVPGRAGSAPSPAQDVKIFDLVLLLELLEESFYREALKKGKLRGELRQFARVVHAHERAHVAFFRKVLGNKASAPPKFDFGDVTGDPDKFAATAAVLEDTGVAAYNGQAANLTKPSLAAAAKIVSVEARHAAWVRAIRGEDPAPRATDKPMTAKQVMAAVRKTGFVQT